MDKIIFIQLNEINFEVVEKYIHKGYDLEYLQKILEQGINTFENETYKNLEPWIQWVSIFKGQTFKEHSVFHLGDGMKSMGENLFSDLRYSLDLSCGAVAPMNIPSGEIDFDFFIPDPWSTSKSIGKPILNRISRAISQGVNDNTGEGLSFKNKVNLLAGLFLILKPKEILRVFKYYLGIKDRSYKKALFLDYILVLLQQALSKEYATEFSTVFLNAGAHIQHHYFFNSQVLSKSDKLNNPKWYIDENIDPLADALMFYNRIIESYEKLDYKIIVMNGLQQIPCEKIEYYYRLSNHENFCKMIGIEFKSVLPRMTRDFEILFESNIDRDNCANKLKLIIDGKGTKVFNELDIRDKSIFCTLTYSDEISDNKEFYLDNKKLNLSSCVNFVAIKNGQHDKNGKFYISGIDLKKKYNSPIELSKIREILCTEIPQLIRKN